MKKILSIVLALVMMMAVTVTAFAETAVVGDNEVQVETKTTDKDGNDAYSYTVVIPATTSVAWKDTTTQYDVGYTVTSQLLIGASLKVNVAYDTDTDDTNNGVMTNADTTATLKYTLIGAGETTFAEVNKGVKTDAKITVAGFDAAPIGTYTGTITYTVEYVAP